MSPGRSNSGAETGGGSRVGGRQGLTPYQSSLPPSPVHQCFLSLFIISILPSYGTSLPSHPKPHTYLVNPPVHKVTVMFPSSIWRSHHLYGATKCAPPKKLLSRQGSHSLKHQHTGIAKSTATSLALTPRKLSMIHLIFLPSVDMIASRYLLIHAEDKLRFTYHSRCFIATMSPLSVSVCEIIHGVTFP